MKLITLLTLLSHLAFANIVYAQDCGLKGTLEQRIRDCNSSHADSILVFKKGKKKIIMDKHSGKLFSAPFSKSKTFYDGMTKCQLAFNNIVELRDHYEWRMTKAYELHNSYVHGVFQQLSRPYKTYWGLPGKNFWMHKAYTFEVMESTPYSTGSYIKLGQEKGREHYLRRQVICVGLPVI